MLKATETANNNKSNDEAGSAPKEAKSVRRGRPPKNKTVKRKRGRPKGSTTKNRSTNRDQEVKIALREQIKQMRAEMRSTKVEFKEAIKSEKQLVKEARKELRDALRREQALISLFERKDQAIATYANRWTAEHIQKIQSPPKRRRRRKKVA